jgi:hypothetical protein
LASVTVWLHDSEDPIIEDEDVDYVSFINPETHGIPALLSGRATTTVEAQSGEKILYVNTALVPLLEVEK